MGGGGSLFASAVKAKGKIGEFAKLNRNEQSELALNSASKSIAFSSITGALVGAFWQYQRTKVHNNWVDTVSGRMGIEQAQATPPSSYTAREDQRKAEAPTTEHSK